MSDAIRLEHDSWGTEQTCIQWIKRYIFFYDTRHPEEMGAPEVEVFLTHLAVQADLVEEAVPAHADADHGLAKPIAHATSRDTRQ